MHAFMARRILDVIALAFGAFGAFILASLFSYSRLDPSLNTSVAGGNDIAIHNWGDSSGAFVADFLLQGLGAASAVFGVIMVVWSYRLFKRYPIRPLLSRSGALIASAILISIAFAHIPSGGWLPNPYLGGSGGALMLNALAGFLHGFVPGWEHLILAGVSGVAGVILLAYSLAISAEGWLSFLMFLKGKICFMAETVCYHFEQFSGWIRHYSDPEWRPSGNKVIRPKPVRKKPQKETGPQPVSEKEEERPARQPSIFANTPKPSSASSSSPKKLQGNLSLGEGGEWELPPLDILQDVPSDNPDYIPDKAALRHNAEMLRSVLSDFNVRGDIVSIHPGPVVTLYELEPAPGIKTSRVISLSDDIARSMSAVSVRCAVVPGRNVIGIEMPNRTRQTVYLRDLLASREVQKNHAKLPLVLGKNIGGKPIIGDLSKMPHLLIAGTTGSGKSVAVNTMILSLLYRLPPEKCRFIMIDPKMLELSVYDDIPHLLSPVVTEPGKAVVSLKWTVQEMEDRYRAMSKLGVRNIEGYNARLREAKRKGEVLTRRVQTGFDPETGKPVYEEQPIDLTELPYIVVVVDEFADLMLVAGKDVEAAIQRLAQMARAAGIHMIMATQRPSVDVITGVIKANFPTRISFAVTSKIDSRTILGESGAEQLLGMGDMLYMESGGRITRVHGPFVSDHDVENVTTYLKAQGEPSYIDEITSEDGVGGSEVMDALFSNDGRGGSGSSVDDLYDEAVAYIAREGKVSVSFIQRGFNIGYNRAAKIVEEMERQGVVSKPSRTGKREILISDFSDVGT